MKKLIIAIVGILLLTFLPGCNTLQTLVKEDGEKSPLGWLGELGQEDEENIPATSNLGDGRTIVLYFPDLSGNALVTEERDIPKTLSLARETVYQWLKGPAVMGESQFPVDPATELLDIALKDGVAVVDLSREFTEVFGNVNQEVAVYGLVNTLTQFPTVREVEFRIEGKPLNQLGNLDVSRLSYRDGLVKGEYIPASKEESGDNGMVDSPSNINIFSPGAERG
ncbi:MAG: GerMN domain-containing protein [Desulfitobacterium sp.]|nr:GerMN domain-containing protein [Desulfitobacterium sp.]